MEEEVYGLDMESSGDDDEENEDEEEGNDDAEQADDSDEEEEGGDDLTNKWGKKKKAFYSRDFEQDGEESEEDEEGALEEEKEVNRLRQKQVSSLETADFDDETAFGARLADKKGSKNASKFGSSTEAAKLVEDVNKALDSLDFENDDEVETVTKDTSSLTKEQKLEIVAAESPELLELLEDFKKSLADVRGKLQPILEKVKGGELVTSKGVSYLETKFPDGKSVKDHPVIDQLVRIRTVLEKMKPLDQKLKYQIDKLLKIAALGSASTDPSNPRNFKPNLDSLEAPDLGEGGDELKVPHKILPLAEAMFDERIGVKEKRKEERQKKKAFQSNMMQFITKEYSDMPEEDLQIGAMKSKVDEEELNRQQYEEDMFIRLQMTKKQSNKNKQKKKQDDVKFDVLDSFDDLAKFSKKNDIAVEEFLESKKKSVREMMEKEQPKQQTRKRKVQFDDDQESGGNLSEDEFFKQVQKTKQKAKKQKEQEFQMKKRRKVVTEKLEDGEKRKINRSIESNRGLTRQRRKDTKTPRTKLKKKFETAKKKQRGTVSKMVDKSKPYAGEVTGVKSRVVRSTSLRD